MVCGLELAHCIHEFEAALLFNDEDEEYDNDEIKDKDSKHHEQSNSRQQLFSVQVLNLVKVFNTMGNSFKEETKDLMVLDTRDIVDQDAIRSVSTIETLDLNQFNDFLSNRLKTKEMSVFDPIKRNNFNLFTQGKKKVNKDKSKISSLKKNCHLFSQLYIASQVSDSNLDEFFCHENQQFPPSLSDDGMLRSGNKSDLLACFEELSEASHAKPVVQSIFIDGPAIVNMLRPVNCSMYKEYLTKVFLPFISQQFENVCQRVDIVWDAYIKNSLKLTARSKRGLGIRRIILPDSKIPSNWHSFLRVDQNKEELFRFLATEASSLECRGLVISTRDQLAVSNCDVEKSMIEPCDQEEADTRMFLHVKHASSTDITKSMIKTVDTDVVVIGEWF